MKKKHFHGLDGLRFISISFVVLHHLFTFRNYFSIHPVDFPVIGLIGYYGIQFFFAGSGFLITYLLLAEKSKNGNISLRHFFLRRVLRIWPAYYLLIVVALLIILPIPSLQIPIITDAYLASDFTKANWLYLLFVPHIASIYYPTGPYVHHTYTIGIEEQFYILWGFLYAYLSRYTRVLFWIALLGIPLLAVTASAILTGDSLPERIFRKAVFYIRFCRISTFAIGALWAIAYFSSQPWLEIFKKPVIQIAVYAWLLVSIYFDIGIPFLRDEYISVLMLCVFTVSSFEDSALLRLDARWLAYLGRISYGIYLFHLFAIVLAVKSCIYLFGDRVDGWYLALLCLVSLGISILFGLISYHTIERFFLRIKARLTRV